jgi:hypothetical protein
LTATIGARAAFALDRTSKASYADRADRWIEEKSIKATTLRKPVISKIVEHSVSTHRVYERVPKQDRGQRGSWRATKETGSVVVASTRPSMRKLPNEATATCDHVILPNEANAMSDHLILPNELSRRSCGTGLHENEVRILA